MKKILLLIIFSFILVGCVQQTQKINQNTNQIEKTCQNFPPPNFCPKGIDDIFVTGTDDNGCAIYGCQSEIETTDSILNEIDLSTNFNYCQTNNDCIAIPNPSNSCYFGYFNKNASKAIEEFENNPKIMNQDCPKFGNVYCNNNKCTADKK